MSMLNIFLIFVGIIFFYLCIDFILIRKLIRKNAKIIKEIIVSEFNIEEEFRASIKLKDYVIIYKRIKESSGTFYNRVLIYYNKFSAFPDNIFLSTNREDSFAGYELILAYNEDGKNNYINLSNIFEPSNPLCLNEFFSNEIINTQLEYFKKTKDKPERLEH